MGSVIHVKCKIVKANKCLYVIRTLPKEGCTQVEVDHLFKAIVLPNITSALAVYGAAEPELTTAQQFLDRCYNRKYISKKLNIYHRLKKQDKKIFKKTSFLSSHPLHANLPKTKQVTYSLRSKSYQHQSMQTHFYQQANFQVQSYYVTNIQISINKPFNSFVVICSVGSLEF